VALANFTGNCDILELHFLSPEAAARECPAAFGLSTLATKLISLVGRPAGGRKLLTDSDNQILPVGTRCRLSVLGAKRNPRRGATHCTVIGSGSTKNQVRVKFDGETTPQTLHRSYLEKDGQFQN
jgi:hypothetical protein